MISKSDIIGRSDMISKSDIRQIIVSADLVRDQQRSGSHSPAADQHGG